jgi:hypothetical protein
MMHREHSPAFVQLIKALAQMFNVDVAVGRAWHGRVDADRAPVGDFYVSFSAPHGLGGRWQIVIAGYCKKTSGVPRKLSAKPLVDRYPGVVPSGHPSERPGRVPETVNHRPPAPAADTRGCQRQQPEPRRSSGDGDRLGAGSSPRLSSPSRRVGAMDTVLRSRSARIASRSAAEYLIHPAISSSVRRHPRQRPASSSSQIPMHGDLIRSASLST